MSTVSMHKILILKSQIKTYKIESEDLLYSVPVGAVKRNLGAYCNTSLT